MEDKKEIITYASAAQCTTFAFTLALPIAKQLDGKIPNDLIQKMITAPEESQEMKSIIEEVVARILKIKSNPWKRQQEKIEKFYEECFHLSVVWPAKMLEQGEDFIRLEYIDQSITEDQIFEAYAKKFGKDDSVWKAYTSITKAIKTQQERPAGNYCFMHQGGIEPDKEHLNKSYNDFCNDGNKYMTPKEGMLAAFRYRSETGNMWDVKGLTRFHARDSGGDAMLMRRYGDDQFHVSYGHRGNRHSDRGPRQLRF